MEEGVAAGLTPRTHDAIFDLRVPACGRGFDGNHLQALRSFLTRNGAGAQDRLVVSLPGQGAANCLRAHEAEIARLVTPFGTPIEFVTDDVVLGNARSDNRGIVRLIRANAVMVRCPANGQLGCASRINLASQLASPMDLSMPVQPKEYVPFPRSGTPGAGVGAAAGAVTSAASSTGSLAGGPAR